MDAILYCIVTVRSVVLFWKIHEEIYNIILYIRSTFLMVWFICCEQHRSYLPVYTYIRTKNPRETVLDGLLWDFHSEDDSMCVSTTTGFYSDRARKTILKKSDWHVDYRQNSPLRSLIREWVIQHRQVAMLFSENTSQTRSTRQKKVLGTLIAEFVVHPHEFTVK